MIRRIACLGCGNVGRSWGLTFARSGCDVTLWDVSAENAQSAREFILREVPEASVTIEQSLEAAVLNAEYIQESIAEQPMIKRELFARLDSLAPAEATIASSTSAIPASILFQDMASRSRCLIVHPVNPPHLIPLVELSPAEFTSPQIVTSTTQFMEALGQAPILLKKEIEGFILNRLQWALLGEALHLVGEGYCEAADIDLAMTHGLARRWAFLGPFTVGHLNASNGIAGYFDGLEDAMQRVRSSLHADYTPSAALKAELQDVMAEAIPVESIAAKQLARDAVIAQLNRFLADLDRPYLDHAEQVKE